MRRIRFTLSTTLAALAVVAATPHAHHLPAYDFKAFVAAMEDPARAHWQKPDAILEHLHLHPGDTVADVGAGTGYFSVRLARAVGPRGHVYAADIDPRAIDYMRDRFRRERLPQATTVTAAPADPRLPARVDVVFLCDSWHHIEDHPPYLRTLRRYLRPGGRVVIVDFKPDADPSIGPPKAMRLSAAQVTAELQRGGFQVTAEPDFLPLQYMLSATLPSPAPRSK